MLDNGVDEEEVDHNGIRQIKWGKSTQVTPQTPHHSPHHHCEDVSVYPTSHPAHRR